MKLLLTGAFNYEESHLDRIRMLGYDVIFVQDERLPLDMDVSEIEGVVCNSLFLYNDIRQFNKLRFIQLTSAGFDRIPLDYIEDQGIDLFNAKGVYSIPMAEWVVLKVLEISKKSREFHHAQINHRWEKQRELLELTDKTASIIGFGSVGEEVAKRLRGFGVKLIGVGRRRLQSPYLEEYFTIDQLNRVLAKSDIVIVVLPYTVETHHLINSNRIANMRDGSILINVSRGGVLEEVALLKAIKKDKFLGVALDVFEEEPLPKESPLWDQKEVFISPHNSFVSDKVRERLFGLIIKNLEKIGRQYEI
jgi:phosphoglycerate dehydrogenase-like enzyme